MTFFHILFKVQSNYMKICVTIALLCFTNIHFGQKIVKQDSSKMIPLKAIKYYNDDYTTFHSVENTIEKNHRLIPTTRTNQEFYLLGNLGTELLPIAYQNNFYKKINNGRNLLDPYFYTNDNIPNFLTNKPISELNFTFFGNGAEIFSGFLTQNMSKNINLGIGIKRANNKGYFQYNQTLHNNFYVTLTHQIPRLRTSLQFLYNDASIRENGGNAFGIYDSVGYRDYEFAITQLTNAINKFVNYNLSLKNRYLILKDYTYKKTTDSLLNKPIKSPLYIDNEFSIAKDKNTFSDVLNSDNKNYYVKLFNDTPSQNIVSLYNNNSILNIFSLNSDVKNIGRVRGYNQILLNDIDRSGDLNNISSNSKNLIIAFGGDLDVNLPLKFVLKNSIYKPISGYTKNDFLISSQLFNTTKNFQSSFKVSYTSQLPGYFYSNMMTSWSQSNHNLDNQKTIELGATLHSNTYKFGLEVKNYNIINFLYLDAANQFRQDINNSILQVNLHKELSYKSLYAKTMLIYENSYYSKLWMKQTLAIKNKAFKDNLNYFIGVDITLNNQQNLLNYNPFLMQYTDVLQPKTVKLYPIVDFFVTLKINSVLLSFIYSNALSSSLKSGTYYAQYYPITPQTFNLKLNWRFLD